MIAILLLHYDFIKSVKGLPGGIKPLTLGTAAVAYGNRDGSLLYK